MGAEFVDLAHVRLRPEVKPAELYDADGRLVPVDRLRIVRARLDGADQFILEALDERGEVVECLQWETLEIALDQAAAIYGVAQDKWTWA